MICNNVILVTVILTQTMPHQTKTPSWPMTRDTSRCPKKLRAYLSCTFLVDGRLQAAKKALCEVPPVRLQCTGGRSPKCVLVQICGGFGAEGLSGCFWCIFSCQILSMRRQWSSSIKRYWKREMEAWWSIVFGVITKLGSLMILLMLQNSGFSPTWDSLKKPFKLNGRNDQPQLVISQHQAKAWMQPVP